MIDYGRHPMENGNLPNRDPDTGIRYGIIHSNELNGFSLDAFEPVYSCACPACGYEPEPNEPDEICTQCGYECEECGDSWYYDEPDSLEYHEDGYELMLDDHGDVWVFKSPHTTAAWSHCSPCAPGAAYLDGGDGVDRGLAYCLSEDWMDHS